MNQSIGKKGEHFASKMLEMQGFVMLQNNFRSKFGEIDIIAIDPPNIAFRQLVFIEVKTRTSDRFGLPQESVTPKKIRKLLKTAHCFLQSPDQKLPFSFRIDTIALKLDQNSLVLEFAHIKNIFNG